VPGSCGPRSGRRSGSEPGYTLPGGASGGGGQREGDRPAPSRALSMGPRRDPGKPHPALADRETVTADARHRSSWALHESDLGSLRCVLTHMGPP
jgi:hypothetical protein